MHWTDRYDLFLFDFDGLLVDTEQLHFESYRLLCKQYEYELDWTFEKYIQIAHANHEGLANNIHPHLPQKDWTTLYSEKKEIYLTLLNRDNLTLMPGVQELLTDLSRGGKKRCVVTHSASEQVEKIKTALPILNTIPVWLTREDYENPKPAPDGYFKAIELLGDPGDRMIGFEDSLRGFQALSATPAKAVLICSPTHPQLKSDEARAATHYSSFTAIKKLH